MCVNCTVRDAHTKTFVIIFANCRVHEFRFKVESCLLLWRVKKRDAESTI
jgi:hypothetical protein